jgi:3-methyladenine DNA glycosylase AlkD
MPVGAFDAKEAARSLTAALRPLGTPERAAQEKRYLKSDLDFLGVTVPDIRRTVKAAVRRYAGGLDRDATVAWAIALWREPVHESRMAAVEVLTLGVGRLGAQDLATVERMIREARTWALVDALACNVAGAIALRDGSAWPRIDRWASDGDFWVRRSALLALLPGTRSGRPDLARFTTYAEPLLTEKEFFIRKAIGWVLREISRHDPAWVAEWTGSHLSRLSGVTFTEAVRRLPASEAERLRRLRERLDQGGTTPGSTRSRPVKKAATSAWLRGVNEMPARCDAATALAPSSGLKSELGCVRVK